MPVTSNMGLVIPSPGATDYPTSVSDAFTEIDAHDHTTGNGVQIPTGGLEDLSVTAAKLAANSVTGAKLNSNVVDDSTLQLSSDQLKIKDAGVTRAKMAAVGQQVATIGSLFTTSSTSRTDVTDLSVSITTTGRPVMIQLFGGDLAGTTAVSNSATYCGLVILRDSTDVVDTRLVGADHALSYSALDTPSAGTYTYKVQTYMASGGTNTNWSAGIKLIVFELA